MHSIGFRAETKLVHYAVVEGTVDSPVLVEGGKLRLQKDAGDGDALTLLRTSVVTLIEGLAPSVAVVRYPDRPRGRSNPMSMLPRARVEGVVVEAVASCGTKVITGPAATIKSGLKTKKPIRDYVDAEEVRGVDLSGNKNANFREAFLAAVSGLRT